MMLMKQMKLKKRYAEQTDNSYQERINKCISLLENTSRSISY